MRIRYRLPLDFTTMVAARILFGDCVQTVLLSDQQTLRGQPAPSLAA